MDAGRPSLHEGTAAQGQPFALSRARAGPSLGPAGRGGAARAAQRSRDAGGGHGRAARRDATRRRSPAPRAAPARRGSASSSPTAARARSARSARRWSCGTPAPIASRQLGCALARADRDGVQRPGRRLTRGRAGRRRRLLLRARRRQRPSLARLRRREHDVPEVCARRATASTSTMTLSALVAARRRPRGAPGGPARTGRRAAPGAAAAARPRSDRALRGRERDAARALRAGGRAAQSS